MRFPDDSGGLPGFPSLVVSSNNQQPRFLGSRNFERYNLHVDLARLGIVLDE